MLNVVIRTFAVLLPALYAILLGCDNNKPAPGNVPPLATARGDTVACPDSLFALSAEAEDPDGPVSIDWSLGGGPFIPVSRSDTVFTAPSEFNMAYPCVLRVTDDSGAVAFDTHYVIVSWIRSPNGGESFSLADSLRIRLFAVMELVGLKLIIRRNGDEIDLNIGSGTSSFSPWQKPYIALPIPDTISDDYFGQVSTVSDSCRIRVFQYRDASVYVESAGFFRIRPSL